MSLTLEEIIEYFNSLPGAQKISSEEVKEIHNRGIDYATERVGGDPHLVIPLLCSLLVNNEIKFLKWCSHFCLGGDSQTRVKELENEVCVLRVM